MGFLGKKPAAPAPRASTRSEDGKKGEDKALKHLQAAGLRLLQRNYRTPGRGGGEIDLILQDRDGTLVFVEVRLRRSSHYGGAGASIDAAKRQRIVRAAQSYLQRWAAPPPCRFDVVLLDSGGQGSAGGLQWLRAAFDTA